MKADIFRKRGEYYLDPQLGSQLPENVEAAIAAAPALGKPVTIIFNGTAVKVDGNTTVKKACADWQETRATLQEIAARHPEGSGAFWKERVAAEAELDQLEIERLSGGALAAAIKGGIRQLVEWMKDYTGTINSSLDSHKDEVLEKLSAAGFKPCKESDDPYGTSEEVGRYIVGRFMENVATNSIFPRWEIYPLCEKFGEIANAKGIGVRPPLSLNGKEFVQPAIPVRAPLKLKAAPE
jgi:hypothetical protein